MHTIANKDLDIILSNLPRNMGENVSAILELDLENSAGETFYDRAVDFNGGSHEVLFRFIDGRGGDISRLLTLVLTAAPTPTNFHVYKRRT